MEFSYKIKIIRGLYLLLLLSVGAPARSQGLEIVKKNKTYYEQVQTDSFQKMVNLRLLSPGIVLDLRYATKNNFTHEVLYNQSGQTFLRLAVAKALQKIQQELNKEGLGLKIFDAYRPYSVTLKMWDLVHDERYVANPAKGSGHNRGLAVDLTIIRLKDSSELDMGTGFDNFTDSAHHDFKQLPGQVLANRALLKETMEKAGFKALDTEWWHYSWPNDRNYPVLDLDFKKLGRNK